MEYQDRSVAANKKEQEPTSFEFNTKAPVSRQSQQPVQIIDIAPADMSNTGRDRLKFHGGVLREILSQVGRKPVALLSITGPSREGKSFLLSYILKYLQSISVSTQNPTSDADWMGTSKTKRDVPLSEGFSWSYGKTRKTVGMWMWPQPFTSKTADDTELDIILMDTQGVFDELTDKKDWATIFGLSLLTSSCFILNIMKDLKEDSLITLKDFMEFGLMATQTSDQNTDKGKNEDGKRNTAGLSDIPQKQAKPFQKLTFLIRDWRFPDEHPYGVSGGADYLKWKLDQSKTEDGKERRRQIEQCFGQVDCFLMPDPGENVKKKEFGGSVAEMDSKFADNVKIFIEHLFDPSNFPPKYISGNLVTGDDLYTHFEQYVRVFNSDEMPSPQDLNGATAIICNRSIVNRCIDAYRRRLRNEWDKIKRSFAFEGELKRMHEIAKDCALDVFQRSRKMGTSKEVSKFQAELEKLIVDTLQRAETENSKNRFETVLAVTENQQQYFNNEMENDIKEACQGHGLDNFVKSEMFESIAKKCLSRTRNKLKEELSLQSFDLLSTNEIQRFESTILSWKANQRQINQTNFTTAKKQLSDTVAKITSDYKSNMEKAIQKSK